jgi:hypothetical protein
MSVYTIVFAGSVPAGGLFAGAIASTWSVPVSLLVGALLTLTVGLGGLAWLRRIRATERRERPVTPEIAVAASGDPLRIARRQ